MKKVLIYVLLWLFTGVLSSSAAKFALLVGIDDYPDPACRLRGCLNDVREMQQVLTGQLGYQPDNILVLTDSQATRRGIEEKFRSQLIERAQPGDEVFFYYSGRGSFIPDSDGGEADGTQGVLCPYDVDEAQPKATLLTDHQLRTLLATLRTDRAVVMLDSCHSGNTTTRGAGTSTRLAEKYMRLGFDPADYNDLPRRVPSRSGGGLMSADAANGGNPGHLILAGCAPDESAYIDEPRGSMFTRSLVRTITALNKETATYDDLLKAMTADIGVAMRELGGKLQQTPRMKGPRSQLVFRRNQVPEPGVLTSSTGGSDGQPTAIKPENGIPAPPDYADFPLTVWPDKGTYRDGEAMRFKVRAGRDCYLRLYHRDVTGKIQLIFPNFWQRDNRVKANETVVVPGRGATFEFTAQPPFGSEMIKALACDRQFADLEKVSWEREQFIGYPEEPHAYAATRTRGLLVQAARRADPVPVANGTPEPAPALSEAEAIVCIRPK